MKSNLCPVKMTLLLPILLISQYIQVKTLEFTRKKHLFNSPLNY